jgi:hypothetical protein
MMPFIEAHPALVCVGAALLVSSLVTIACMMGAPVSRDEDGEDTWL